MIPRIWALMFTKFHVFFQHLFKTWNTIVWTSMVNLIVNPTSDPLIHITLLSLQLCMIYALSTLIWSQKIFFLFLQITSKCQIIRYCDIKKKNAIVYIHSFIDDFVYVHMCVITLLNNFRLEKKDSNLSFHLYIELDVFLNHVKCFWSQ